MAFYNNDETAARISKVQAMLEGSGLDAALIYYDILNIANGWYITGWCPQFESGFVLIPKAGDALVLGGCESAEFAKMDSGVKEILTFSAFMQPGLEFFNFEMHDFRKLQQRLQKQGAGLKKIGIVGMDIMPAGILRKVEAEMEDCTLADITADYELFRLTKSKWEIDMMLKAAGICDEGYAAMAKAIRPGASDMEIAAEAESACLRGGANGFGFKTIVAPGERINGIITTTSGNAMQAGEMAMLGLSPRYYGYSGAIGDTLPVSGEYTAEQRDLMNRIREAFRLTRGKLGPGKPIRVADEAGMDYLRKCGWGDQLVCQFVHSTGLNECEGVYYLNPDSSMEMRPGMTVMIDVSLFGIPKLHGGRVETGYVITETGHMPLSPKADAMFSEEIG